VATPYTAAGRLVDDRRVLRLPVEDRSSRLLGLCAGDRNRSQHENRCCQSHGEFSHQTLLVVMSGKVKRQRYCTATTRGFCPIPEPAATLSRSLGICLYGQSARLVHTVGII